MGTLCRRRCSPLDKTLNSTSLLEIYRPIGLHSKPSLAHLILLTLHLNDTLSLE
uniref:Uncharacterized protein n=1 Tax=Anguilla anguilla TaxID=7936 RepID=A0A0E9PKZ2_ANGAN